MARPKLGSTDTERMQLKITAAEVEAIDDWRFTNRVPSRSEAVRRLVQMGLYTDRLAPDLWQIAKNVSDYDDIRVVLGKISRNEIDEFDLMLLQSDKYQDRIRMMMGALTIKKIVDAFREGATIDDAIQAGKSLEEIVKHKLDEVFNTLKGDDE